MLLFRSFNGIPIIVSGIMQDPSADTMSAKVITCRYILHRFSIPRAAAEKPCSRKKSIRATSDWRASAGDQDLVNWICKPTLCMNFQNDSNQVFSVHPLYFVGESVKTLTDDPTSNCR
jgi:hypothetical protein